MSDFCLYRKKGSSYLHRPKSGLKVLFFLGFLFTGIIPFTGCKNKSSQEQSQPVVLQQRLRARVQTLDPMDVRDTTGTCVASDIFDTLYDYHYLKRPYQVIPMLAAEMPTITDDGKCYTIPIRKDVYFHDDACFPGGTGRLLKAQDVVFAWKRIADVKTRSVSWWIFDRRIAGLDDFREYTKTCQAGKVDYDRPVEGLQTPDDYTLRVKLNKPWPQFIFWLTYIATAPVAREAVEYYGPEIGFHPVGTGAFKVDEWQAGAFVKATRNPRYFQRYPMEGEPEDRKNGLLDDAGRQLPLVDKVIWRIIEEDQPRWRLFMTGFLDMIGIPKDNFGQVFTSGFKMTEEFARRNIRLEFFNEPSTMWVAFNMKDPLLGSNKPLRQAISYSIDRKRFIEVFFDGRAQEAFGVIPPVMPGYDPNIISISNSHYDMTRAIECLQEARKIAGGQIPRMRIAIGGTDSTNRQMCQFMQRCIRSIGLDVEIDLYDWPTFLEKLRKSDMQMFIIGWTADYPDVESFLQLFYSGNIPYPNEFSYTNPQMDEIFEKVTIMPDCPERLELYQEAQKIINEDLPCAFTFHRVSYIMCHEWIHNVKPNSYKNEMAGWGMTKYYRIDPQKRKEYQQKYR